MIASVVVMLGGRLLAGPLGPNDVDPDGIRDRACSLTAPSRVCNPEAPDAPDPPDLPDPPNPAVAGLVGNLLVAALVLLLIVGLVWLVMQWLAGRPDDSDDDEPEVDLDEDIDGVLVDRVLDHQSPPDRWRRRAREHADRGEFREAIRCRYRALVGDLARAGYVDEIAGRTSGEEREQVATTVADLGALGADAAAGVNASFEVAANRFDVAWFDDAAVVAADHDEFMSAEDVVLAALASGPSRRRSRAGVGG